MQLSSLLSKDINKWQANNTDLSFNSPDNVLFLNKLSVKQAKAVEYKLCMQFVVTTQLGLVLNGTYFTFYTI